MPPRDIHREVSVLAKKAVGELVGREAPDEDTFLLRRLTRPRDKLVEEVQIMMATERVLKREEENGRLAGGTEFIRECIFPGTTKNTDGDKGNTMSPEGALQTEQSSLTSDTVPSLGSVIDMAIEQKNGANGHAVEGSGGRKTPVMWSEEEQGKVIAEVVRILRTQGMQRVPHRKDTNGNGRLLEAFNRAQKTVLPSGRHKSFLGIQNVNSCGNLEMIAEGLGQKDFVPYAPRLKPEEISSDDRRTQWTEGERKMVAAAICMRLRSLGCGQIPTEKDRTGSSMLLDCARAAQNDVLPPTRRKTIKSRLHLSGRDFFNVLEATMREQQAAEAHKKSVEALGLTTPPVPITPVVPLPVAPQVPPPATQVIIPPRTGTVELPPLSEEEMADPILHACNALMLALRVQFKEMKSIREMDQLVVEENDGLRKRMEEMDKRLTALEKNGRREDAAEKAALPSVAILGCRKDEFDLIVAKATERGLKLDLRLYEQDTKPRPINAQWAVSMKFMGHAWDDHVKACTSRGQYVFLRGGISQVIAQLEVWFSGQ